MIFQEPEIDYFRMQLHNVVLPLSLCVPSNSKKSESVGSKAEDKLADAFARANDRSTNAAESITPEERAAVLRRALLLSLHQRFPYESHDTLENVYVLAITHLSAPLLGEAGLSYEDLVTLRVCQHSLPPELQSRTFPSHLNALMSLDTPCEAVETPHGEKCDAGELKHAPKVSTIRKHFNDSYFILIPELTDSQRKTYEGRCWGKGGPPFEWTKLDTTPSWGEMYGDHAQRAGPERPAEDVISFQVVEGDMIHYVEASRREIGDSSLRSLRFSVFKVALSRFSYEEQGYYIRKCEQARCCADAEIPQGSKQYSAASKESYMNKTMRSMLASEVPARRQVEEEEIKRSFFSKCNSIIRSYTTPSSQSKDVPTAVTNSGSVPPAASLAPEKTAGVVEPEKTVESPSHLFGVRRLVYSFAPCDCYHLVTDDNNPWYYARSSRAPYSPRTVDITLISDLTALPRGSSSFSPSPHRCSLNRPTTDLENGLVVSGQASRATSPAAENPQNLEKKATLMSKVCGSSLRASDPAGSAKESAPHVVPQRSALKTEGVISLTTSLACNDVSGNVKHMKESLVMKGLTLGVPKENCRDSSDSSVKDTSEKAVGSSDIVNLFRLLSTSSIAQHQLRHNVIRPVISVAVLDNSNLPTNSIPLKGQRNAIQCHGLLDHTWYSIPIQSTPPLQDDVRWVPVLFGSSECISDVGYRTAMHIGFFPDNERVHESSSNITPKNGIAPPMCGNGRLANTEKATRSAMTPLDTNVGVPQAGVFQKAKELSTSKDKETVAFGTNNEDAPASVTARRGGVAMTFGANNEDAPASVTARRGGVAMTFGTNNEEAPASVTARRGGVAMTFGTNNEDAPASVTARRGGVAMTFGTNNEEAPASVTARRGGVAMTFGTNNEDAPASVTARRGGVAMTFGTNNEDAPASVTARRGGVAMTFGTNNEEAPASVTARRGGVAMTFGTNNEEAPASVTARRGGVAMTFGTNNEEAPASVTARRGGVAMTFGTNNEEAPASVTARRGGVAMTFGTNNEEAPASVTARRGGVAMTFGTNNEDAPASATARRGGVAMTFGTNNEDAPASATARRGGVAMTFGANCCVDNENANPFRASETEAPGCRKTVIQNRSPWDQRRSASFFSPRPRRPTCSTAAEQNPNGVWASSPAEPEARGTRSGLPSCFESNTNTYWHSSSQGRLYGENYARVTDSRNMQGTDKDWQRGTFGNAFSPCGASMAGPCAPAYSRSTSVLDPFGKLSRSHSPLPYCNTMQQKQTQSQHHLDAVRQEDGFHPPHADRWHGGDAGADVAPRGFLNKPNGFFWRSSPVYPNPAQGSAIDPLISPVSSLSRSGFITPDIQPPYARMGNRSTGPDANIYTNPFSYGRQGIASTTGSGPSNMFNSKSNIRPTPSFRTGLSALPNRSFNPVFDRMSTLYDNGASRMPIIDEYGPPRGISRVRPRGVQAMDMLYANKWIAPQSGSYAPPLRGVNQVPPKAPWRSTTTTEIGSRPKSFMTGKPPLAPTRPFKSFNAGAGATSPAGRPMTLRERVLLRRRELQREANLDAFKTNLNENYCVGNDAQRLRRDNCNVLSEGKTNTAQFVGVPVGENVSNDQCSATREINTTFGDAFQSKESLASVGEEILRTKSLASASTEADGINVSFSLRDLANALLQIPRNAVKEYDLSKGVWLDDGISCFVSSKPKTFSGGFESYMRNQGSCYFSLNLREKALMFVFRVPSLHHLRVVVAIHNMQDFLSVLQGRPLRPIGLTEEQEWVSERINGGHGKGGSALAGAGKCRVGRVSAFARWLRIFSRKGGAARAPASTTEHTGWTPMTWGQRCQLLRIQVEASMQGQRWHDCVTPLLTDPVILYSRMAFLSNRIASYVTLRNKLDTLKVFAATWVREEKGNDDKNQMRLIQNSISTAKSVQLGCDSQSNRRGSAVGASSRRTQMSCNTRLMSRPMASRRTSFRARAGPPFAWKRSTQDATEERVNNKEVCAKSEPKSTIASYSSSASLNCAEPAVPQASPDTLVVVPHGGDKDALFQIVERLMASNVFLKGKAPPPPMETVLRLVTSWEQGAQRQRAFNEHPAESTAGPGRAPNPACSIFRDLSELQHQQGHFDISVSHIQQLLQWQWEHHQSSYEVLSLPVFRKAIGENVTAPTEEAMCDVTDRKNTGISPLSRSLLLALSKWGWVVPINYKKLRRRVVCRSVVDGDILSSVEFGFKVEYGRLCLWILGFMFYQKLALTFILLRVMYSLFYAALARLIGVGSVSPAPLRSAVSIVYSQSEASVEVLLEKQQHFLSQLLVTRVLQVQHFVYNLLSRVDMLLRGHSPILSFIIGAELMLLWVLFICCDCVMHVIATASINAEFFSHHLTGPFSPVLQHEDAKWFIDCIRPSSGSADARKLAFPLWVTVCFFNRSPLRWMLEKTWLMFLHDDALVRRPVLSF